MRVWVMAAAILVPAASSVRAQVGMEPGQVAPPVVEMKASPFPLRDVRITGGPLKHAMDLDHRYLLSLDPDRLLHTFRVNAGIPSSARPLGGWEEPNSEVRGHFVGHYLSACAQMYAATADRRLLERAGRVVAGMAECQRKLGGGYLSAYPESFIDRVEALKPVWAPYYTLHKILAGLLDMHRLGGNRQALEVARRFGDWFVARNARLTDAQMQAMLGNEHGGVNDGLAELYAQTGDRRYLETAQRFNHHLVMDPAARRQDRLTGLHANTQIPKFIGNAREYEFTGKAEQRAAATFFWETVTRERSYVIGGHSDGEMFSPKEKLSTAFGPSTTETCNTYNMLKLTRHLFCWEPRAEYADYYERALLNHILASQDPVDGMMCYYVPLRTGSAKVYSSPMDSFWCCTGTGVENHARYGDGIYYHSGDSALYVNLFVESRLDWRERGVVVNQSTRFPDQQGTRLVLECRRPTGLSVMLRRPYWAGAGYQVRVNGAQVRTVPGPGSYVMVRRTWRTGDTIEVRMPFALRTEGFRDNPNRFAFLYGPLVLASAMSASARPPVLLGGREAALRGARPVPGKPNRFYIDGGGFTTPEGAAARLVLEPFYAIHGGRHYQVYWDAYTEAEWSALKERVRAAQEAERKLDAQTVDKVVVGFDQDERDHNLQGEKHGSGPWGDLFWRHAPDGWFSWDLKVEAGKSQSLRVTYWGSDRGGRDFDILVDGKRLATVSLVGEKPESLLDKEYPLPAEILAGKSKVTVRFQAHPGNIAGGVFGVRVMRAK